MRIIGGTYKRKNLSAVPGMSTRPTSDRLRESLFNIIGPRVDGWVVLDLFAGTGALGLEALSRGADFCVFVDHQKKALSVIRKNIASCTLEAQCRVIGWDISRNLTCLRNHTPRFNLVFMDPPYNKDLVPQTLLHLIQTGCLAENAQIVCEHDMNDTLPASLKTLSLVDQRRYGRTCVSFFEHLS